MNEKFKTLFCSVMIAGIIVVAIGMYFCMGKAGIPYQDPTPEMTMKWMAYYSAGKTCLLDGAITFLIGITGQICCSIIKRSK